ncbi:hypothetical protein FE257_000042 [Aspergillus nanangensis]|uniref:Zn(2)-C6 fungal-type domain-containing protein n=1 Tax=Aspergillus nanangensis TaxID=2582783 RepID=A0AAD4CYN0_ASPNN|nr:hypothetical protein FE257_000042 [Aspergillus nanangensis]
MPGVPSSRGCEACRKVKKKCDQAKPSCSRCTRLEIPCVGSGQKRYKFIKEQKAVVRRDAGQVQKDHTTLFLESLRQIPSNEITLMGGSLVSLLNVEDVRYDVSYYGPFLGQIPKYLGTNKALDSAVGALTHTFTALHTNQLSREAYTSFGKALKNLRTTLLDPEQGRSVSTMCAIYLIMVCEGWLTVPGETPVNHGEAMMHIMNTVVYKDNMGTFESQLLYTLAIPVIMESVFNPKIKLSPWLDTLIERCPPPRRNVKDESGKPFDSMNLRNLSRYPVLLKHPEHHYYEILSAYEQFKIDFVRIEEHLLKFELESTVSTSANTVRMLSRFQAAYCMILGLAFILNKILRAYNPGNDALEAESLVFFERVMEISRQSLQYRPIGACFLPVCMAFLWVASDDEDQLDQIQSLLITYQPQFAMITWVDESRDIRGMFHTVLGRIETPERAISSSGDSDTLSELTYLS